MTVYIVAKITIKDRDTYGVYGAGFMDILGGYAGKLLAVDENPETIEGDWTCTRTVILSFPGKEEMKAWYSSPAYQALAEHRYAASKADIALVEGLAGVEA
jgi:uncharacterized protein (DUF1330 family)